MDFQMTIVFHLIFLFTTLIFTIQADQCAVDGTKCQLSDCAKGRNLPICAAGFASGITGGKEGVLFTVSDPSDNPYIPQEGTLRYYVLLASNNLHGAWIVFKSDMTIKLLAELWTGNNTAIDGRGFNVKIIGHPIMIGGVDNVILENLEFGDLESSAVHAFLGSSKIWLDHLSINGGKMGFMVANGSTDVTISNCHLAGVDENMILGARDADTEDQKMRVTVYRNFFDQVLHNMPQRRFGYCHIVNNYYRDWVEYTLGGRANARIYSEMNIFQANKTLEATPCSKDFKGDTSPVMETHNDMFLNHSSFTWFKHLPLVKPLYALVTSYPPLVPTTTLPSLLNKCVGDLYGPRLTACAQSL